MIGLSSGAAKRYQLGFIALIVFALIAVAFSLRGSALESARDFEECVEAAGASPSLNQPSPPLNAERDGAKDCHARFAGRRKPGGGYTYYDFMQDRNFDMAGPNPTVEERKAIDYAYMGFLDSQRREAISAELAIRQNERLRADLESASQPVGPPLVLMPRNSVPIP